MTFSSNFVLLLAIVFITYHIRTYERVCSGGGMVLLQLHTKLHSEGNRIHIISSF